ncbi:hypothetical protein BDN72DRAFT_887824 [Pluteus cervinus]|uniref:Uncharacterized protein n=1 Tax=Pluteus cervinus TaxID=181527 RepID=A0ACD3AY79_9AGAR|nr:hypothetical protein BDN72DRAFT_887824 [Pluteus cervinus]
MPPFHKALNVVGGGTTSNGAATFRGVIDPIWSVGAIPHGGYVLALIIEACIKHQHDTPHQDPIHVTAHYLRPSSPSSFEVHIRIIKVGKGFTNLTAELVQNDVVKVTTHLIFGDNNPNSAQRKGPPLTILPPSGYARRLPLYEHPSQAKREALRHTWTFHPHVVWAPDQQLLEGNKSDSPLRTTEETVGGGGVEWGVWFEFTDAGERVTNPYLPFLVDIFLNFPSLLPKSERVGLSTSWFPTMTLSLEFKFPIPPASSVHHSARTVGLYSSSKFMQDPQGRHEAYVEVWTAPTNIGEGKIEAGWRDRQVCLAVATQMALTIPFEVNLNRRKIAKEDNAKL